MTHLRHHAKVAATATQRPKQLRLMIVVGSDDPSIRENDLGGDKIVERQSETADERPVAAAQSKSSHANGAARARHGGKAARIGHGENVRGAGPASNLGGAIVGTDDHTV